MATISMCAPPLVEPPFLDLKLTMTEAKALRAVLGGIGGGYGSPLTVPTSLKDSEGELRDILDAIWQELDEVEGL